MEKLIDVVIINWNSEDQLQDCLASIRNQEPELLGQIVVVDNSASIRQNHDLRKNGKLNIITPQENLGFGAACNLGAEKCAAPFILFLNPDIRLLPSTFGDLMASAETTWMADDVGIVGIQLIGPDGQVQRTVARFPKFSQLFARMLALDRVLPKLFLPHFRNDIDYEKTQVVEQVPGAFFLVRRAVFDQLGGFDSRFFMYYEDVDFCYRAFLQGWKTLYYASAAAHHAGGGTTHSIKDKRLFYLLRSRVLYIGKHFGRSKALAVLLGILTLEFFSRIVQALLRFSWRDVKHVFQAYQLLIRDMGKINQRL